MNDYRRSMRARRHSWFGLKRHVKRGLSLPGAHRALRAVVRGLPSSAPVGRLPAPAHLTEVRGRVPGGEFVLLAPERCEIAKELYWGGGRRPRPADALALDVVVALARDADLFLDVGAYTGLFTVATTAVNPRLRAHAFEIVPAVAEALRANVERNGVADRVVVHHEGVGDPGTTMRVPTGKGGSALPSFYSAAMTFDAGVEVGFRSLDELGGELTRGASEAHAVGSLGRVVMKIDVEGAEEAVLGHGRELLSVHRPDILCEVLHGVADGQRLTALLAAHGLRFYLVREESLLPAERIVPDPVFRDWLVTPRDPAELVALGIPVAGSGAAAI